jgi:hypothetical protein
MLKKGLLASGGLLLLLALLFGGRNMFSYVATVADNAKTAVADRVPIEFELDRARKMIADLSPEISKHKREIAREELELRKLEGEVKKGEEALAKKWSDIQRLRDDLQRGDTTFVYASGTYTAKQVETDLTGKFNRYTKSEATVDQNRQILEIRRKGLSAAQEKLMALISAKQELEVEIENLEARLKMVEVAKATSELNIDDSQLSRTRELLSDIEARIEVEGELVNAEDFQFGEIRVEEDESVNTNILDRITRYETEKDQTETYVDVQPEE